MLNVLPIGGSGEVGLNATRYALDGRCIVVDFGALLGVEDLPSVNRVVPDVGPLLSHQTLGLLLTHGHEDHIGAIPQLLDRTEMDIYGLPLPLELVKSRLQRDTPGLERRARFHSVESGDVVNLAPFEVEFVSVTHSIPDCAILVVRAGGVTVVHTGDFKLDRDPVYGETSDLARLEALGDLGVDLLMSDSTNAERAGRTPSETSVVAALEHWVRQVPGRAVVTFVSSQLHRMRALAEVAHRSGRRVAVVGRSMERNLDIAERLRLFSDLPRVTLDEAARLPPERVLVLATGSQAEPGGALSRLARGELHPLHLSAGDAVAFSARVIPGRELAVRRVQNRLRQRGIAVATPRELPIHTSGHAQQEEQAELIRLLRPRAFVPMHGDRTMLEVHAETARRAGVDRDRIFIIEDGESLNVTPEGVQPGPVEEVPRHPVDEGGRLLSWDEAKARRKLAQRGLVRCAAWLDSQGRLGPLDLAGYGVDIPPALHARVVARLRDALDDPGLISMEMVEQRLLGTLRMALGYGRPGPWIDVALHRWEP